MLYKYIILFSENIFNIHEIPLFLLELFKTRMIKAQKYCHVTDIVSSVVFQLISRTKL